MSDEYHYVETTRDFIVKKFGTDYLEFGSGGTGLGYGIWGWIEDGYEMYDDLIVFLDNSRYPCRKEYPARTAVRVMDKDLVEVY